MALTEDVVLAEIKKNIKQLPNADQIRVEVIAMTLRNCIELDPEHARLALALVGAEQAAED